MRRGSPLLAAAVLVVLAGAPAQAQSCRPTCDVVPTADATGMVASGTALTAHAALGAIGLLAAGLILVEIDQQIRRPPT